MSYSKDLPSREMVEVDLAPDRDEWLVTKVIPASTFGVIYTSMASR
jgi:hypothetical protein